MTQIASMPRRHRLGLSWPLLVMLAAYAHVLVFADKVLGDPDTYLHVAVGRWIIAHRAVPHEGIFSATMPHAPWVAHEWLSEVVLAGLFEHFGRPGLVAATGLCVGIALAMFLRELLRSVEPVHALIATVLAYLLAMPHILARPHIFTLPILVAWVAALVRARSEDRAPSLWLILLMALWANLHGGYVLGWLFAAMFAGEAVLLAGGWAAGLRAARSWAIFGALLPVAALLTPFGIDGLLLPLKLSQMSAALAQLKEWKSPDFQTLQPVEVWILPVLFGALALGWRLPPTRAVMLLVLLHLALRHLRFGEVLGFAAPLLAAPSLASRLGDRPVSGLDHYMTLLARPAGIGGVAVAAVLVVAIGGAMLRGGLPQAGANDPAAALAAVKASGIAGPVLNDYGFGGYLIFSGVEPFIDGRAELYGDAFIARYVHAVLLESDQLPQLLTEHGITWTLFSPNRPAVTLLDHLPNWQRFYADEFSVVHVRTHQSAH